MGVCVAVSMVFNVMADVFAFTLKQGIDA